MTDEVESLIGGLILITVASIAFVLFDAFASNPTLRTPQGMMVIRSATDGIVLRGLIGLPSGLLIVTLLRILGGR